MTAPHLWVRAEQRDNETRVGITPEGVTALMAQGFRVTVEASDSRVIATDVYAATGCTIAPQNSWPDAPAEAIIFGLKELPEDGTPLVHRHIMFGHAYKGQSAGRILLQRFKAGGGTLLDLEYLTDETGRRVAAFGYWAGFAGAAVAVKCWAAQTRGQAVASITPYPNADALTRDLAAEIDGLATPDALVIGALGRVGSGAADLCGRLGIKVTIDNTRHHMHHKFAVFDQRTLLTGSYNWTRSAAKHNDENILVTHNRRIAERFQSEFNRLWDELQ